MDIKDKLKIFINENLIMNYCALAEDLETCKQNFRKASINSFINEENDNNKFQKVLFEYIDQTGKKDSDIYNKALIDRRLFSKIRNNENYHPSKETVICLGIALELSIEEFENLLLSASYSLPKNNTYDLIIRFCIIEKIYDINTINTLLDEYRCDLLAI